MGSFIGLMSTSTTYVQSRALMLVWDKLFAQTHAVDEKSTKNVSSTSTFSKHHPHKEPQNPKLDG